MLYASMEQQMENEEDLMSGFLFRNESQRLLEQSKRDTPVNRDDAKIAALVEQGRFVVVLHYLVYCRNTDAILGTATRVVSDHARRTEANIVMDQFNDDGPDPECYYAVYPVERAPEPVCDPNPNASDTDDIPF